MEEKISTVLSVYQELSTNARNSAINNSRILLSEWDKILINDKAQIIDNNKIVIDTWCNIIEKYKTNFCSSEDIEKIVEWHQLYLDDKVQHSKDGHNFNIFTLLRDEFDFKIQETMHSKLIKFLLDPYATHGQGDKFLIKFLELLKVHKPEKGIWNITAEQGKIDILLKRDEPKSIIIIENKSNWAGDQPNQLYRYWYNAIYLQTKKTDKKFYDRENDKYQIIYLPPNICKQYEEQSISKPKDDYYLGLPDIIPMEIITLTYDCEIQQWLNDCKKDLSENHRIREYISQYQLLCKTL
jgi:hypothetical protein